MKLVTSATPDWPDTAAGPRARGAVIPATAGAVAHDASAPAGFGGTILNIMTPAAETIATGIKMPAHPISNAAPAVSFAGMFVAQATGMSDAQASDASDAQDTDSAPTMISQDPVNQSPQPIELAGAIAPIQVAPSPVTEASVGLPETDALGMTTPMRPHAAAATTGARAPKSARPRSSGDSVDRPVGVQLPGLPEAAALPVMASPLAIALARVAAPSFPDALAPAAEPTSAKQIVAEAVAESDIVADAGAPPPIIATASGQRPGVLPQLSGDRRATASAHAVGHSGETASAIPVLAPPVSASSPPQSNPQPEAAPATRTADDVPQSLVRRPDDIAARPEIAVPAGTDLRGDSATERIRLASPKAASRQAEAANSERIALVGSSPASVLPPQTAGPAAHAIEAPAPETAPGMPTVARVALPRAHADPAGNGFPTPLVIATPDAPAAAPVPAAAPAVVVATRPSQLAGDVGLAIARQIAAEGNALHIRLDPKELGRIEVRMSFDERGTLRAVVAADSAVSLDLLRRDSADLGRAMTDAGVRSDSQSFRFQGRGEGHGGDGGQQRQPSARFVTADAQAEAVSEAPDPTRFRPLRWRGQINVLA